MELVDNKICNSIMYLPPSFLMKPYVKYGAIKINFKITDEAEVNDKELTPPE